MNRKIQIGEGYFIFAWKIYFPVINAGNATTFTRDRRWTTIVGVSFVIGLDLGRHIAPVSNPRPTDPWGDIIKSLRLLVCVCVCMCRLKGVCVLCICASTLCHTSLGVCKVR